MPYSITLAGQDITKYADQLTVSIHDTLGQGQGAGSSGSTQGRASTFKVNTSLGPMNSAVGAGEFVSSILTADSFNRVNQTGFGTSSSGNTYTEIGTGTASISSNEGVIVSSGSDTNMEMNNTSFSDVDMVCRISINNSGDTVGIQTRFSGTTLANISCYKLLYYSAGIHINKEVSGTITNLVNASFTMNPGTFYWFRLLTQGTNVMAKVWQDGTNEPSAWQLSTTDSSVAGPGAIAVIGNTAGPSTGVRFDSLTVYKYTTTGLVGIPQLVRMGEIIVTDATGTVIYGGYATKYTDTTTSQIGVTKQNFTTIEAIDYSTSLQRIMVNEFISGMTDVQAISFLVGKYAPWVNLTYLPVTGSYRFSEKRFRNQTLEQVIQTIAGITGYLVFVDYLKFLHYVAPTTASSAPYNLSDSPDFVSTFPHAVEEFTLDDNAIINRVFFYGGTSKSNDYTQDLSPQANGSNTTFILAYYPSVASDGAYHVTINSVAQVIGLSGGTGAANTLKSQGGNADVLLDWGNKTLTFNTAPASGATVQAKYRYNFPMALVITDENSHKKFGVYLDGVVSDNTIFDRNTAIQRCKVVLSQQSLGLVTLKVLVYNKPGVQAGMIIHVVNVVRGINASYLVQEVEVSPIGGGNFAYHMTLGAWNWNLIDYLLKLPTLAAFMDDSSVETLDTIVVEQVTAHVQAHAVWSSKTTVGPYYARAAVVGDGHDSFPGFATISS